MNNENKQNDLPSQVPPQQPSTLAPIAPQPPQQPDIARKFSPKKLAIVIAALVCLMIIGVATYLLVLNATKNSFLSPSFAPVSGSLSDEELLKTALERLLSVKQISYDVTATNVYGANVTQVFNPGAQEVTSNTSFEYGDTAFELHQKAKDTYFRYTKMPKVSADKHQYLNKWILINETTSKNVGAGSEFLGFIITSGSSMDAPIFIGNLAQSSKDLVKPKIDSGLYKILSAERTKHKEIDAVKYTLTTDYKQIGKLFRSIYDKHDSSAYIQPSYFMSAPGYDMGNAYDSSKNTVTIFVSPVNAQVFEIHSYLNTDNLPAFSSQNTTYDNFKFDGITFPEIPKETIPLNEFYK